ncbi:alpha/beta fold hydrolase [Arthrobacter sp. Sa2BUA2]|uniref:Alpha/beta fold hydrolase n=1 Tax=Arthrobacter pullicola TaxID=2762224 RepID=A0ABR8YJF9_9MICC|nr:alpha/beta fold hydrolase [Arthrobacter pullicola]MBD8044332.1 alpha/beta fold hydrolase [Arthrobacter pullicola]
MTAGTLNGTGAALHVEIHEPAPRTDAGLRPILLLHGFASSTEMNWQSTGWIPALTEAGRRVIAADLPGHGRSPAPADRDSCRPSSIRAGLLQLLIANGVRPLVDGDESSGVDVAGYSLGSRLAWELGAEAPGYVHRMVLGGPGTGDPLADFDLAAARESLAGGAPLPDPVSADLLRMATLVPSNDLEALFTLIEAIKQEPFQPAAAVPAMPLLLVAGDKDTLAVTAPRLAELSGRADLLLLPGRSHANAVTSRAFKTAAVEFLGPDSAEST